jgi:Holliday junction DNA helicase RuvB
MDAPGNEINDVAPSSLKHIVGQKSVVEQVAVALEAAFADQKKFDSALLVGPSGCGKTAVANVIAAEMATDFTEVLGQSISSLADLNALLLGAKDRSVIHIDEAHELNKSIQTALYLALDRRKVILQGGRTGNAPQSIPIADFTLLLSSTEEFCLLEPLRMRCRLVLRFQFYDESDLETLVRQHARALRWQVDEGVLLLIPARARGTPRLALRLLQSCRRVCRSEGETVISVAHVERACQLEQIDDMGLGPTEQKYLEFLAGGASRLNVLSSLLGLPARTVSQVTEQFLIRAGLIIKDDQGRRQLTALGREHMSEVRAKSG